MQCGCFLELCGRGMLLGFWNVVVIMALVMVTSESRIRHKLLPVSLSNHTNYVLLLLFIPDHKTFFLVFFFLQNLV